MKKLEDAIENIKEGCILTISRYSRSNEKPLYSSCLSIYDGLVFQDVKAVELGNFLNNIPNIQKELDNGYAYKVKYLFEQHKYQSTIIRYIKTGGYKERIEEEIVDNYLAICDSFLDSIIELDTKLATKNNEVKHAKTKVMA